MADYETEWQFDAPDLSALRDAWRRVRGRSWRQLRRTMEERRLAPQLPPELVGPRR